MITHTVYLIVRTGYLINRTANGHDGKQSANVVLSGEHLGSEMVNLINCTDNVLLVQAIELSILV